jgi:hypothetical protein
LVRRILDLATNATRNSEPYIAIRVWAIRGYIPLYSLYLSSPLSFSVALWRKPGIRWKHRPRGRNKACGKLVASTASVCYRSTSLWRACGGLNATVSTVTYIGTGRCVPQVYK